MSFPFNMFFLSLGLSPVAFYVPASQVTRREQISLKRQEEPEGETGQKLAKGRGRGRGRAKGKGRGGRGAKANTKSTGSRCRHEDEGPEDTGHEDEEEEEEAQEELALDVKPGRSCRKVNVSKEKQMKKGKEEKALSGKQDVADDGSDNGKVKKARDQKKMRSAQEVR